MIYWIQLIMIMKAKRVITVKLILRLLRTLSMLKLMMNLSLVRRMPLMKKFSNSLIGHCLRTTPIGPISLSSPTGYLSPPYPPMPSQGPLTAYPMMKRNLTRMAIVHLPSWIYQGSPHPSGVGHSPLRERLRG